MEPTQHTSAEHLAFLFKQHAGLLFEMSLAPREAATTYFNTQAPPYAVARAAVLKLHQHQAMSDEPQLWQKRQCLPSTTPLPKPPTYFPDVDEFDPFQTESDSSDYSQFTPGAAYRSDAAFQQRAAARPRF